MTLRSPTTPWFNGSVQPVREGVYQREHFIADQVLFSYWGGNHWGKLAASPRGAVDSRYRPSMFQQLRWRGLVEEVK